MILANRDVMLSTADPHLAFEVVSQTDALMIGTTTLSRLLLDRYQLKAISLPDEMAVLFSNYQLTWHRLMNQDPAHMWFRGLLFEECQKLLLVENTSSSAVA